MAHNRHPTLIGPNVRFGHKRTFCDAEAMSALPPKADSCSAAIKIVYLRIISPYLGQISLGQI